MGSDSLQTVEAYSLKVKFGEHELYYTRTSKVLYKKNLRQDCERRNGQQNLEILASFAIYNTLCTTAARV